MVLPAIRPIIIRTGNHFLTAFGLNFDVVAESCIAYRHHFSEEILIVTFTIRASRDGETMELVRLGARGLFKTGWMVQIIDSDGLTYAPSEFDQLLSFDRVKSPISPSQDGVLNVMEEILRNCRRQE